MTPPGPTSGPSVNVDEGRSVHRGTAVPKHKPSDLQDSIQRGLMFGMSHAKVRVRLAHFLLVKPTDCQ